MPKPTSNKSDDRVEIFYSAPIVTVATAIVVFFAGWIGFWMIAGLYSGHILAQIIGALAILFLLPMLLPFVKATFRAWRHKGPVVIIDSTGITDVRKKCAFIPWTDVDLVRLGVGETASYLCIGFRRPDGDREDGPALFGLGALLKRSRSLGDWNVSLRMLACRRLDVLRVAQSMRQKGLRRQIVDMNKSNRNGWSGTL